MKKLNGDYVQEISERLTDTNKSISFFKRTVPDIFGTNAPDNSLQNLLKNIISTSQTQVKAYKRGSLLKLCFEGELLKRYGFPLENLSLILDQLTPQVWSFTVESKIKGKYQFALEWNSDLRKNPSIASRVKITYKIDYLPRYLFNCQFLLTHLLTNIIHRETIYKINDDNKLIWAIINPYIKVLNNMITIRYNAFPYLINSKQISRVYLRVPLRINFII